MYEHLRTYQIDDKKVICVNDKIVSCNDCCFTFSDKHCSFAIHNMLEGCQATHFEEIDDYYSFLLPEELKKEGFNLVYNNDNKYYKYENDGTKHRNYDYNPDYPEPKGKVVIYTNLSYTTLKKELIPIICIKQDGDTRTVYNGLCPNKKFLLMLLNNIR